MTLLLLHYIPCIMSMRATITLLGSYRFGTSAQARVSRASTEVTFGRGDLSVCPLGGFTGAHECPISKWKGVPQGSPQVQTLRALLLRGTSVLHRMR